MSKYHIGEEINKEMRRQGMRPGDFASALHRERTTLYDIFKKNHIATDLLADICRVLNHDFFSELSHANFDYTEETEEDEAEIREMISGLMPESELHAFSKGYMVRDVFEEFLSCERAKPMVVFYSPSGKRPTLPTEIQHLAGKLWDDTELAKDVCKPAFSEPGYPHVCRRGNLVSLVLKDRNYANAIKMAEDMSRDKSCHVILYIPIRNSLRPGAAGGLVYEDIAEELFESWQGRAHFVYYCSSRQGLLRQLYQAYRGRGIIDRLIDRFSNNNDVELTLYELILGRSLLSMKEINPDDSTGLSRFKIFYRGFTKLGESTKQLMYNNGINDQPRLEMWLDIRNGCLVDFQYNKRTQS